MTDHRHPSAGGPTRAQAERRHLDLASALVVTDDACRRLSADHDPRPVQQLLEAGDPLVAWAACVLYSHALEHGGDAALDAALDSLRLDIEAAS
ncbi:MAG: hypothetical protein AB7I24_09070 [Candidatus Nanopelagicales bacterium]